MSNGTTHSECAAPRTRVPLYLTLAGIFVTIFVAFGVVLILFFHSASKRIELLGASDLMDRIGSHIQTSIAELYQPAQGLVDIASKSAPLAGSTLDERLTSLGALTEALRLNPDMSSIFVGYEDGDFFLVRSVGDRRVAAQSLDAPRGSRFAVQSIEGGGRDAAHKTLLFYSEDLTLLDSRPLDTGDFDPRSREWYRSAIGRHDRITTDFYVFFTTGEVGLSFARQLAGGGGVVGADLALSDLSAGLARQRVTESTRIALFDDSARVIALSRPEMRMPIRGTHAADEVQMPRLSELDDPAYRELAATLGGIGFVGRFVLEADNRTWLVSVSPVPSRSGAGVFLATLIPRDELLVDIDRIRNQGVLISIALLMVTVGIVLWVSGNLSHALRALAREAEQIRRFNLTQPITARSRIAEVDDLASTMALMKNSLQQFLAISTALSAERDYRKLLEMVLREARTVSQADGGAILMTNDDESGLEISILENTVTGVHVGGTSKVEPAFEPVSFAGEGGADGRPDIDRQTAQSAATIQIADLAADQQFDASTVRDRFDDDGYVTCSLLSVPLTDQKDEIVGLLQLVKTRDTSGEAAGFAPEVVSYIEALASDAAVALDLRRLLKAQRDLLESFIHVVAGAIDAKSPYTHGHCQRVPVLARMLAEAAHAADDGPLCDFELTDDEKYELHIASWLHDCGKVTTPEYVVDKSTKLETIYNRIHEIRTRFEVLWRDAEIGYLRVVADRGGEDLEAKRRLEERLEEIRDDYAFVAECNLGELPVSPNKLERLRRIGGQSWRRNLDDRIGLSHEELVRKEREPGRELPVLEPLIADKTEHVIERVGGTPFGDNRHGFDMEMPEDLYNLGELYNLSVARGTLTAEERFKINEHIVQTINMLGRLPFPKELRRVPDWAGSHHEKLDGTGYPRRLGADDLSTPARIMAIADIFEALTATDRPYMRPKSLNTAIRIMGSMRDSGHICPDLFALFLTSGAYLEYAEQHLQSQQLKEPVDIEAYLRRS